MTNTIIDVWDSISRRFPSIVYVQTVSYCNANCLSCVNDRIKKPRGIMSLDNFKIIADKVKSNNLRIGAMYGFGEPLIDPTLLEKFEYGNSIGVFNPHIGFNTNGTFLTEEKFDRICKYVPNITISIFNTGTEYERLTGGLSWEKNYSNIINFIKFRDTHYPNYPILIGTNEVTDHNVDAVREAFKDYKVTFVSDPMVVWGQKYIVGMIDKLVKHHALCDGHVGTMQVLWNGDCGFCCFDMIGTDEGIGETYYGNILRDSIETLEINFKKKWREPSTLCKRCDYFYLAKHVIANKYKNIEDEAWKVAADE